jgi:threonine aldolase
MDYFLKAKRFVEEYGLKLHLDGARIFNAAVKCRVDVHEISQHFDSISVCLSKGLGAPVGSVLCGDHDTIARARRWRKMLGGGMRQAGILAAAAVFALEKNRGRLEEDHQKAQFLADELGNIEQLSVDYAEAQTNMVFVNLPEDAAELKAYLEEFGVLIPSGQQVRLVLHLDISKEDVSRVVSLIKKYFTA